MQLNSVSISGFRSIAEIDDLEIGSPTLLAGHNDAGKTSILDAIRFLLGAYQLAETDPTYSLQSEGSDAPEVPERVGATVVSGSFRLSESEQEELGLGAEISLRRIARLGETATLEIRSLEPDEALLRDYQEETNPQLTGRIQALGLTADGTRKASLLAALDTAAQAAPRSWRWATATSQIARTLPRVELFGARSVADAESAIKDSLQVAYRSHLEADEFSGDIRAIERNLEAKLADDAEALRGHIAERCGDIGQVVIRPEVNLRGSLSSTAVSMKNSLGEDVPLSSAGTGRARRIAFAVWEYTSAQLSSTSADLVLLYDEPDTHLDYQRQRDFMAMILEQAQQPNVRIVIGSHSLNLIDGVDIADVIHVHHDDTLRSLATRLTDDSETGSHLGAIAASLGLRNTVLLHERLFVGVEGATEAQAIPVLFKKTKGRHLESYGIAIWPCDNHEGAMKFAKFLHDRGRNVAFLVDEDARSRKHVFSDENLRKSGLDPDAQCLYVGDPNELEEVFPDELWAKAGNALWPRTDGQSWTADLIAAVRQEQKFSDALLEEFKINSEQGPMSKPEMVTQLAITLTAAEIPDQLVDRFDRLIERAR